MATNDTVSTHAEMCRHLREVRDETLEQARLLRQLATQRRELIHQLIEEGFSQAEIARELGVTRQAIQQMLACEFRPGPSLSVELPPSGPEEGVRRPDSP